MRNGGNVIGYSYTLKEKFLVTKGNLFWKIVDRLSCKVKRIAQLYEKTVGREYRKEGEIFDISNSKNILHIGCGSYPITAMTLAKLYDANIVTIDTDAGAVTLAKRIISKYNLADRVQAKHGNGTKYPLEDFDTVIISGCSVPKIKVLNHVLKNASPKSTIIIRSSILDIEAIVDSYNPKHDIKIIEKTENSPFPTARWESYYIKKER